MPKLVYIIEKEKQRINNSNIQQIWARCCAGQKTSFANKVTNFE